MKRTLLCALMLSFSLVLSTPCALASNYADYDFTDWSDDQVVFLFKQAKGEMVKRNLPITENGTPSQEVSNSKFGKYQFNENGELLFDMDSFSNQLNSSFKKKSVDLETATEVSSFTYKDKKDIKSCYIYELDGDTLNKDKKIANCYGFDLEGRLVDGVVGNMAVISCYGEIDSTEYAKAIISSIIQIFDQSMSEDRAQELSDTMLKTISDDVKEHIENNIVYSISYHPLTHTQFSFEARMWGVRSPQSF